jgi:ribose/xylose/arabinose/galactoside ABC-type transport system permease subunit
VLAVLAALAVGVAFGVVNGLIVAKLGVNDFIVTLGTLSVAAGALRLLDSYRPLRGGNSATFEALAGSSVLGIPLPVIIGLAVVLALDFVLRRTAFGRMIFAVGINPEAAHLAGIRVDRVRFAVFVLSGAVAALSGVLLASRLGAVPAGLGRGFELDAIAAAVLGGTSLAGGRGTVIGTVVGALILATLRNGLQLAGVDVAWYTVIVGLTIVGAVALDERVRKIAVARLSRGQLASSSPSASPELIASHTEVR